MWHAVRKDRKLRPLIPPAQIHLTLPGAWQNRRLRVPDGLVLHHAFVSRDERVWVNVWNKVRPVNYRFILGEKPD